MRISKTVIFSSVIAVTALVIGVAVFLPANTNDIANLPDGAAAPVVTTTLEPVVVVAAR